MLIFGIIFVSVEIKWLSKYQDADIWDKFVSVEIKWLSKYLDVDLWDNY